MSRSHFQRHRSPAGSAPGTLIAAPDSIQPVMRVIRYSPAEHTEHTPKTAEEARALVLPDHVTWIDVVGIGDPALVEAFGRLFKLHRLALSDVMNTGQRPKVDDYGDSMYVAVRMVTLGDDGVIRWEQVSLFLGRGFVISFQERPGDCLNPLRLRLKSPTSMLRRSGSDYLAIQVLDSIVDGYFPVLEEYGEQLEELEAKVIDQPDAEVLADVYQAKRELVHFRRAVWPLRDALSQVLRDGHTLLSEETLPYLRDINDHVMHVVDVQESYRELAGSFIDVYLSGVSNRTNEVMKVLTVISTIFIPLTFIAGVYGMNFDPEVPGNMPELRWSFGYPAFWIFTLVVATTLLIVFRRLGWLGGGREPHPGLAPRED